MERTFSGDASTSARVAGLKSACLAEIKDIICDLNTYLVDLSAEHPEIDTWRMAFRMAGESAAKQLSITAVAHSGHVYNFPPLVEINSRLLEWQSKYGASFSLHGPIRLEDGSPSVKLSHVTINVYCDFGDAAEAAKLAIEQLSPLSVGKTDAER